MREAPPFSRLLARSLIAVVLLSAAACSSSNPTAGKRSEEDFRPSDAGSASLSSALTKGADINACKGAIQILEAGRERLQFSKFSDEEQKALIAWAGLENVDATEVLRSEFTANGLDPHYLAEAILLRDVVRSFGIDKLPLPLKARFAFDWVCREVYYDERGLPPVPIWYILQRGCGNGLERTYVLLGLFRQMGLDACLIGSPEIAKQAVFRVVGGNTKPVLPRFWAVGVRDGEDILLLDPWRGQIYPGPKGEGIATLRQAQTDEALAASWNAEKSSLPAPAMSDWKKAEVYVAAQMPEMAPRMNGLEKLLGENAGVVLRTDILALRDRLAKECKLASAVRFWNPPGDLGRFGYSRVLSYFLPLDQGGLDRTPPGQRLVDVYELDLIPWAYFPPLKLQQEGRVFDALQNHFKQQLTPMFKLMSGLPRDHLLRGQFSDATKLLMDARERSETFRAGLANDQKSQQAIDAWCAEAEKRFADVARAQRRKDPVAAQEAEAAMSEFLNKQSQKVFDLLGREAARIINMDATYLLALAVHERALRSQLSADRQPSASIEATARSGWKNAQDWWQRFLNSQAEFQQGPYAGRFANARALLAEAQRRAAPPGKASP